MSSELLTILVTGVVGILGGGGVTALFNYLQVKHKDRKQAEADKEKVDAEREKSRTETEIQLARLELEAKERDAERPIDHYNTLVEHLAKRVEDLEVAHQECNKHHAACERQVGELRGELRGLQSIVDKWFAKVVAIASQPIAVHVEQSKGDHIPVLLEDQTPDEERAEDGG